MSTKDNTNNKDTFIKLWIHELLRIFGDRLVEKDER